MLLLTQSFKWYLEVPRRAFINSFNCFMWCLLERYSTSPWIRFTSPQIVTHTQLCKRIYSAADSFLPEPICAACNIYHLPVVDSIMYALHPQTMYTQWKCAYVFFHSFSGKPPVTMHFAAIEHLLNLSTNFALIIHLRISQWYNYNPALPANACHHTLCPNILRLYLV